MTNQFLERRMQPRGSVEYRGHTLVSDIDTGYAWDSNDSDGGSWEES